MTQSLRYFSSATAKVVFCIMHFGETSLRIVAYLKQQPSVTSRAAIITVILG